MVRFASRFDHGQKKALRISSGALLRRAEAALVNNCNKVRIARADYPLGIYEAVHVN
jgi:hypothetical protein